MQKMIVANLRITPANASEQTYGLFDPSAQHWPVCAKAIVRLNAGEGYTSSAVQEIVAAAVLLLDEKKSQPKEEGWEYVYAVLVNDEQLTTAAVKLLSGELSKVGIKLVRQLTTLWDPKTKMTNHLEWLDAWSPEDDYVEHDSIYDNHASFD